MHYLIPDSRIADWKHKGVDAICIDQDNDSERNVQVKSMNWRNKRLRFEGQEQSKSKHKVQRMRSRSHNLQSQVLHVLHTSFGITVMIPEQFGPPLHHFSSYCQSSDEVLHVMQKYGTELQRYKCTEVHRSVLSDDQWKYLPNNRFCFCVFALVVERGSKVSMSLQYVWV
jgi:hypothetical protein